MVSSGTYGHHNLLFRVNGYYEKAIIRVSFVFFQFTSLSHILIRDLRKNGIDKASNLIV